MKVNGFFSCRTQLMSALFRCLPVLVSSSSGGDWMPVSARAMTGRGVALPAPPPLPLPEETLASTPQAQVRSSIWPSNPFVVAAPTRSGMLRKNATSGAAGTTGSPRAPARIVRRGGAWVGLVMGDLLHREHSAKEKAWPWPVRAMAAYVLHARCLLEGRDLVVEVGEQPLEVR